MRQRILLGILAVLAALSWWLSARNASRIAVSPADHARPLRAGADQRAASPVAPAETKITRNPFEYGGPAAPVREARPQRTPAPAVEVLAEVRPTPPRVRLVGVVRPPAGVVKAALAVDGEVLLLAPGGAADGYTVLEILDDQGVRVRTPSGEEMTLSAAR
jgi:hypothetical protein